MSTLKETSIQLQELTLEVNLIDDTWVPTLTDEIVAAIVNGIDADQRTLHGWENVVRPALSASNVTRVNDTVLAVTFRHESYDLAAGKPELLTVTVPPSAVASAVEHVLSPSLQVEPIACTVPSAVTSLPLVHAALLLHQPQGAQEASLRHENGTMLLIRLHGCT